MRRVNLVVRAPRPRPRNASDTRALRTLERLCPTWVFPHFFFLVFLTRPPPRWRVPPRRVTRRAFFFEHALLVSQAIETESCGARRLRRHSRGRAAVLERLEDFGGLSLDDRQATCVLVLSSVEYTFPFVSDSVTISRVHARSSTCLRSAVQHALDRTPSREPRTLSGSTRSFQPNFGAVGCAFHLA